MSHEPELRTEVRLWQVLEELQQKEPLFHRLELATTRTDFELTTAPDFWETGASGKRYSREFVWATLEARYSAGEDDPCETSEFQCREASPDTYLLTYTLRQNERMTRRLTVWRRRDDRWQALYHQGTPVAVRV
jgi:hypothetical protein